MKYNRFDVLVYIDEEPVTIMVRVDEWEDEDDLTIQITERVIEWCSRSGYSYDNDCGGTWDFE